MLAARQSVAATCRVVKADDTAVVTADALNALADDVASRLGGSDVDLKRACTDRDIGHDTGSVYAPVVVSRDDVTAVACVWMRDRSVWGSAKYWDALAKLRASIASRDPATVRAADPVLPLLVPLHTTPTYVEEHTLAAAVRAGPKTAVTALQSFCRFGSGAVGPWLFGAIARPSVANDFRLSTVVLARMWRGVTGDPLSCVVGLRDATIRTTLGGGGEPTSALRDVLACATRGAKAEKADLRKEVNSLKSKFWAQRRKVAALAVEKRRFEMAVDGGGLLPPHVSADVSDAVLRLRPERSGDRTGATTPAADDVPGLPGSVNEIKTAWV